MLVLFVLGCLLAISAVGALVFALMRQGHNQRAAVVHQIVQADLAAIEGARRVSEIYNVTMRAMRQDGMP